MAAKALPCPTALRQLLRYEPETGKLFWKPRGPDWFGKSTKFTPETEARQWNARFSGKEIGGKPNSKGYVKVSIRCQDFSAHRIIWQLVYGEAPEQVDHINGIRSDNRITNLRAVSNAENTKNQKERSSNTSGMMGVTYVKKSRLWYARVNDGGKQIHLGSFDTFEEAASVRRAAEARHGYHANHGRRAATQ